jgi:o-succinylbenzoate synthase
MRLAAVRFRSYRLALRRPWRFAGAALTERAGFLVEVAADDGTAGIGDCAPLSEWGTEPFSRAKGALIEATRNWPGRTASDVLEGLPRHTCPAASFALETALLDLLARRAGPPLACYLGAMGALSVPVNAALGALDDGCAERAKTAAAAGYLVGKVKLGLFPWREEAARLRNLCAAVPGLVLRGDANGAWGEKEAIGFLAAVAVLPLDGIEEPLRDPDEARLARLQAVIPFPLALDESLPRFDVAALAAAQAVRRITVKATLLGGLGPALDLARRARAAGLEVVVTSCLETAVGVTAAAHLAAVVGGAAVHGLATAGELVGDPIAAPPIAGGRMLLAEAPGLGIVFSCDQPAQGSAVQLAVGGQWQSSDF